MELVLPTRADAFSASVARAYLRNFTLEFKIIPFTAAERAALADRRILGKLLDARTRPAFLNHFGPLLAEAVNGLWSVAGSRWPMAGERRRIVELGCGSGTCSILFGLLGAQVAALDQDPVLVSAARRRMRFYQSAMAGGRRSGDGLDVTFERADAFEFDYSRLAPIDGVYSLFAFNLMQPSSRLLDTITPHLAPDARFVISDGNRDGLYNRLFRARRCMSPRQVEQALEERWQHVSSLSERFHAPVPPAVLRLAERTGLSRWLGVSYTLVAAKGR